MTNLDKILNFATQFEYHLYAYASKKDKEYLLDKYPELQQDINKFNNKYINWLALRFGQDPKIQEVHPIGDCLETLLTYQNKDSAVSQKYTQNEEFKNKIDAEFPINQRKWTNPADSLLMTVDEMEKILVISSKPKSKNTVEGLIEDTTDKSYKLPTEDLIGKVGPWNIWVPSSRENSCKIAGYDPVSLKPFTTWCTARTKGSNLFYSYVGAGTILYYLIKDNPVENNDWLSVGFRYGSLDLEGQYGGISVNRDNSGLTRELLRSILGGNYDAIIEILQKTTDSLGGKSPAYIKIEEAANDIDKYNALIRGNSEKDAKDLKLKILDITTNEDLIFQMANDKNSDVRCYVVKKTTNEDLLKKLSTDEDEFVKATVAAQTTNEDLLIKLMSDQYPVVRDGAIKKFYTENFIKQIQDENILAQIILAKVSYQDRTWNIWTKLAEKALDKIQNENILLQLAISGSAYVKFRIIIQKK